LALFLPLLIKPVNEAIQVEPAPAEATEVTVS
jgi:hypothetical protein